MPTLILVGSQVADSEFPPRARARLGDRIVFSHNIEHINGDTSPSGAQHSGFGFLVREQPDMWLCEAGFILPGIPGTIFPNGGQIQGRGLMDFAGGAFAAAITGGTVDYRRAQGQIDGRITPSTTEWTLTIDTP